MLRRLTNGDGEERSTAEVQLAVTTDLGEGAASPVATGGFAEVQQLVARLRSPSGVEMEAALCELYRRHGGTVLGFATACTGDAPMAEQVTVEVFAGLAGAPHLYDPGKRTLRAHLVAQAHRLLVARGLPVEYKAAGPWRGLPQEERVTLAVVYFGGMTRDEVADVLGVPSDTVAKTIDSALRLLRGR